MEFSQGESTATLNIFPHNTQMSQSLSPQTELLQDWLNQY